MTFVRPGSIQQKKAKPSNSLDKPRSFEKKSGVKRWLKVREEHFQGEKMPQSYCLWVHSSCSPASVISTSYLFTLSLLSPITGKYRSPEQFKNVCFLNS